MTMTTERNFDGKILFRLRRERGLTRRVLAAQVGRSAKMIEVIEQGRAGPSLKTLAALSVALDVPIDDLFSTAEGRE